MIFDLRKLTLAVVSFTLLSLVSTAPAAMVAYYDFEENTATTTTDNVGPYTGTLHGDASIVAGKYGSGVSVQGAGHVDGFDHASFQVPQGTVMAWYNAASDSTESQIVGVPAGDSWSNPWLGLNIWRSPGGGNLGAQANHNGTPIQYIDAPGTPEGEWHHIAASYDGQFAKLYVNGQLKGAADGGSAGGSISYTGTPSLSIGVSAGDGSGNHFVGIIDEVKLFNTALSAAEIQAAMVPEPVGLVMVLATLASLALTRFNRS